MMASALYSDVYPERVIYDLLGLDCGHRWVFPSLVGYFEVEKNRTGFATTPRKRIKPAFSWQNKVWDGICG